MCIYRKVKMVGKWLRVNRSCSCLAVLSSTAWDLLTIFTKLFNSSVHTHTHGPRGHLNTGCLEVHLFSNLPGNHGIVDQIRLSFPMLNKLCLRLILMYITLGQKVL